jgi:hydrogenase maturation protease
LIIDAMKKPIAVIGLGNPLMADEGIGVILVEQLALAADAYPGVEFIDAGTGGMAVLHIIEGRSKVVFIDCAFMDAEPGTIRRFTPDEVRSTKTLAHQSLHEADLLGTLDLAGRLGQKPDQIVIFGIQPERVAHRLGVSAVLAERMDRYLAAIQAELTKDD